MGWEEALHKGVDEDRFSGDRPEALRSHALAKNASASMGGHFGANLPNTTESENAPSQKMFSLK